MWHHDHHCQCSSTSAVRVCVLVFLRARACVGVLRVPVSVSVSVFRSSVTTCKDRNHQFWTLQADKMRRLGVAAARPS